ncbi:MAG: hypothetical protein ABJO09_09875 [Hyphomicrobiales bacterium]
MKRSTNKKILKFALLPMVVFAIFAFAYPVILTGADSPTIPQYIGMGLWVLGVVGFFVFWTWGVGPHAVSAFMRPLEIEAEKGWHEPNGYSERTLKQLRIFKFLNIYIGSD